MFVRQYYPTASSAYYREPLSIHPITRFLTGMVVFTAPLPALAKPDDNKHTSNAKLTER